MRWFRRRPEEFTFAPAWKAFAAEAVAVPPFLNPKVRGRSVLRGVGVGFLLLFLLWALGTAVYARDEFLYELSKVQFPWEDASTRTVLVAHHKTNIFQPGADGPAMQESFVDIPAAYLVRHEESWAGLDAQGRFTQLMARTSEPWLGRSSESNITRDGEFFKSVRIFPGRP